VRDEVRLKLRESSVRTLRARIGSVLEKERDDLVLVGARALHAARAGRVRHGVERCRALPALTRVHTSAALEEAVERLVLPIRFEMLMALS
jgi:hypothetical protein